MRPGPLILLLTLSLPAAVQAEQSPPAASAAQAQIDSLEQRLAISEEQRDAMAAELQANDGERESAQLQRLRQENQRLKLQLKKAQAQAPQPLISEQQRWFAIGAGAGLLGVIIGALLRGSRRSRREWLN
ncbi:translation initiation factor 2 [Pseudomonas sp.]|uniref:translation initiation factor 2 n=1 Tax=Pseudomonas sp. TaxID=306 RepID=UPI002B64D6DE|nr:translation initiation factor 2 [Pseudomonas sp.]HUE91208.1 translation initiation factor 2 [Pseudomonas sp.]